MENGKKIAVAVVCADGRLHQDVVHFNKLIAEHLQVDLVDVLAVAGPDGVIKPGREGEKEALVKNLQVLIGAHKPVALAFVAHQACAGNPVSDEQHELDVKATLEEFQQMLGFAGDMVALVAQHESDTAWPLKEIVNLSTK
jgi:hypothetical protein